MLGHISSKGWYEAFEYTSLPLEIFDLPQNFIHGKKNTGGFKSTSTSTFLCLQTESDKS